MCRASIVAVLFNVYCFNQFGVEVGIVEPDLELPGTVGLIGPTLPQPP